MAYITGNAASFADLKSAIETACTANGWALTSGVLNKSGVFIRLTAVATSLRAQCGTGQSGATLLIPSPRTGVKVVGGTSHAMTWPITYEINIFTDPDEVIVVINYNSDYYQQISFGKSNVAGIGGSGNWLTGSYTGSDPDNGSTMVRSYTSAGNKQSWGVATHGDANYWGLFVDTQGGSDGSSFIHVGLDGSAWLDIGNASVATGLLGGSYCASLITSLPNAANNTNVLLPVKAIKVRNSGGRTIVANPKNVRYLRVDNLTPGEIITYGGDQWKVYPMYRKDATAREGVAWATGASHSGTYGYAVRYTG